MRHGIFQKPTDWSAKKLLTHSLRYGKTFYEHHATFLKLEEI